MTTKRQKFIAYAILLLICFSIPITFVQARSCGEKYEDDGQCKEECADWESADKDPELCSDGDICCHEFGATINVKLQIPILMYTDAKSIYEYIGNIYVAALYIIVPITIVIIIIAGIAWIGASGDTGQIKTAKSMITRSLIGLGIALLSYTMLSAVGIKSIGFTTGGPRFIGGETMDLEFIPEVTSPPNTSNPNPFAPTETNDDGTCASESQVIGISNSTGVNITGIASDPRLLPSVAQKLQEAGNAANRQGCTLQVTSAYRSHAKQRELYNAYQNGTGAPAARPSCSAPHQTGGAVDVGIICRGVSCMPIRYCSADSSLKNTVESIMNSVGFSRFIGEWWHFEYGTARWNRCPGGAC